MSLADRILRLAGCLLADCERAGGRRLRVLVLSGRHLRWVGDASLADETLAAEVEDAASVWAAWRLDVRGLDAREGGDRALLARSLTDAPPEPPFATCLDLVSDDRHPGEPFQSPDVLNALRLAAARTSVRFGVELGPGFRDVQRARAGLASWADSAPGRRETETGDRRSEIGDR